MVDTGDVLFSYKAYGTLGTRGRTDYALNRIDDDKDDKDDDDEDDDDEDDDDEDDDDDSTAAAAAAAEGGGSTYRLYSGASSPEAWIEYHLKEEKKKTVVVYFVRHVDTVSNVIRGMRMFRRKWRLTATQLKASMEAPVVLKSYGMGLMTPTVELTLQYLGDMLFTLRVAKTSQGK
jgi:hypothetical protein